MVKEDERKKIINDLQSLAETVHALKEQHRQKHPIVIEFSGSPKAGKTSSINSLELFLKRNGFKVKVVQERASVCPVTDKQSPMFNIWTACMSLAGMLGTLEDKSSNIDVLILDRGIFDALCWFEWLYSYGKMDRQLKESVEAFLLQKEFVKSIDIVFAFKTTPETSIEREYANLLTDKLGSIMNPRVLQTYLDAIEKTHREKENKFQKVFIIDTTTRTQDEVGKDVTEKTLNTLRDVLMERIGFFKKTDELMGILNQKSFFLYDELKQQFDTNQIAFDYREDVEKQDSLLQPIPIAVITNTKNRVLVVKKSNISSSEKSPEKDRVLPYVGGHTRREDIIPGKKEDFLDICKTTLKREIQEEIGISVSLDNIIPNIIYTPTVEKSKKHLAICFRVTVEEDTKLRLDAEELVQKKGVSKSGRFLTTEELNNEPLEDWGKMIMKKYFKIEQYTLFNNDNQ